MEWTPNLAYAVELITADGCLSKDGRHIDLTSKDIEQIKTFSKILNLKNKISLKSSSYSLKNKYYRVQFGRKEFYRFLLEIGLMPNKSKRLGSLKIPGRYFADFLRGYLDGDGFTYSYWDKRWKRSFMLYLGFVSASRTYLEWLRDKIGKLYRVDGVIKWSGKSTYQLIFAKKSSILLLEKMYYHDNVPCLRRKKVKIEKSLGIINKQAEVAELVYAQP